MTSKLSEGRFQQLLLPLFLIFCFGGTFFMYYKPSMRWISCPDVPVSTGKVSTDEVSTDEVCTHEVCTHEVCTVERLRALMENFTQIINTNSTLNSTLVKQQLLISIPTVMEENKENNDHDDIILLIWSWPFGFKFDVKACGSEYGIKGCHITDDRNQYNKAHGVIFHHKNIGGDFTNLLKRPRPPHQKWVWMTMESPDNTGRRAELDDVFNLTANYRKDSDVWVPYGRIIEASEKDQPFTMPPKDKIVCWIVSHWNPNFRRVKYFSELGKYIKIEAYGRHFNRYVSTEDYNKILPSCKFYLSFENSIYKDYITEKVFNPMKAGTVPVVLGPPRENYEEFLPADSFIHVDDFESPQKLAEHLKFLDQNKEAYEHYFTWRQHFTVKSVLFGLEHACRSCYYIRNNKGYRVFKNLNKWFWG
ncbi:4-galactosyl-N-acetylglucosaminide 3-alpha-L-fucosyltransferase 9-like [Neoarius graeffei]|uniref:4-galactosyl-N-acetylglucosaminide 3-alpha-L-fucosyltransferase 9-like n=1 Tax=Neoarius graeffei TaxID=443677 RepID=UPI00298D2A13|nr:4-galactosyl-N-acetylglucosaminide 3-alpha-L-fucosyltransferase 9-like [Neoarius graeffei]XP_060771478.1 4-galactosyl-N-acetylglucosaminide 3-alpha-L-fucosyltransferase 9-like [Neoarius graeffei]XP_060771479.1 4-galactosyl-N-acetylglucosaminide 3-alpha-L-fucosyltransferase 9-like [Neoarius graeffei]